MAEGFSLADQLINPETVAGLMKRFADVFDPHPAIAEICAKRAGCR